jgi:hypothetical protein
MALALMLCQKHGVPQSACMMVTMALLTANYSIKTGFGISTDTYSSTEAEPTHGPGQGSRLGCIRTVAGFQLHAICMHGQNM